MKLITNNLTNIKSINNKVMINIEKVYIEIILERHSSLHWFEIVSIDVLLRNKYLYKVETRINFWKEIIKIDNSII